MSVPVTPPPPVRGSSTTLKIVEIVAGSLKSLIVGAMLFGPGLYWFIFEMKDASVPGETVHIGHISFAVGLMVAGAIAIQPKFGEQITKIYVQVFPNGIPLLGGRRASDPQPDPKNDNPA